MVSIEEDVGEEQKISFEANQPMNSIAKNNNLDKRDSMSPTPQRF